MYKNKLEELKKIEIIKGVIIKTFNKYGIIFELLNFSYYKFSSLYDYNETQMNFLFSKEILDISIGDNNENKIDDNTNNILSIQNREDKKDTVLKNKNGDCLIDIGINEKKKSSNNDRNNDVDIKKENFECEKYTCDIYELYQKEYKLRYLLKNENKKKAIFINKIEEQDLNNEWPYNITIDIIFANIQKPNEEIENMMNVHSPLKIKNLKHLVSNKMHLHDSHNEKNNIIVDNNNVDNNKYLSLFRPYKILVNSFKAFKEIKITTYYKYINNTNIYHHIWNKTDRKSVV